MITAVTIPKELIKKGELIIIPREEYDEFLELKKISQYLNPLVLNFLRLDVAERQYAKVNILNGVN